MLIYLSLAPLNTAKASQITEQVAGTNTVLQIVRDQEQGPYYAHWAERLRDDGYALFAGRLPGVTDLSAVPLSHPVALENAENWGGTEDAIEGSWLALKYNRRRDILSLTSDLFLIQQWYYYQQGDAWHISNSLLFLKQILGSQLEVEANSIPYMLRDGYLPEHLTPLKGVKLLMPGQVLTISRGKGQITTRTALPVGNRPSVIQEPCSQRISETLLEATSRELENVESVILPLSGGIDSRFLLACALDVMDHGKITTFSYGYPSSFDFRIGKHIATMLGIRHVSLALDDRPIGQKLPEMFQNTEGMYWAYPDFPLPPMRAAVPPQSIILSGYLGDGVYGHYELSQAIADDHSSSIEERLLKAIRKTNRIQSDDALSELLGSGQVDPLNTRQLFLDLPGTDLQERYNAWAFRNFAIKRLNYAVFRLRDRAFYLTPFTHRRVLDAAFSLTAEQRRGQSAYYRALADWRPEIANFPTKNNYGFPLDSRNSARMYAARAWRKLLSEIDQRLGARWGTILYHHPRNNYMPERDLRRKLHREDVVACIDDLRQRADFNRKGLDNIKRDYLSSRPVNPYLLRGLLTVGQWFNHYES
jgi:hypothetical protein